MKTIKIKGKKGIDNLKGLHPWIGGSQGDTSTSDKAAKLDSEEMSWMIYVFKGIDSRDQEAIDKEIRRRKRWNANYIKKLRASGEYGKEYTLTFKLAELPEFTDPRILNTTSFEFKKCAIAYPSSIKGQLSNRIN